MRHHAVAVICFFVCLHVTAAETQSVLRVADLIDELGSESFDLRQRAQGTLQSAGTEVLAALTQTAESHEFPEVRVRCRLAIAAIELNEKMNLALIEGGPERLLEMFAEAGRMHRLREMDALFKRFHQAINQLPDSTDDELTRVNMLKWRLEDLIRPEENIIFWTVTE